MFSISPSHQFQFIFSISCLSNHDIFVFAKSSSHFSIITLFVFNKLAISQLPIHSIALAANTTSQFFIPFRVTTWLFCSLNILINSLLSSFSISPSHQFHTKLSKLH